MFRRIALSLALLSFAFPAIAQSVQQSGSVTSNTAAIWNSTGVIKGGVTATDSPLTTFGVTRDAVDAFCVSSARQTAVGRNQLCFQAATNGAAKISLQNYGTATAQSLEFVINGTAQGFPTVTPLPVVVGNVACFSTTSGALTDCGSGPLPPLTSGYWYVGNVSNIATATPPSTAIDSAFGSTSGAFMARGASTWAARTIVGSDLPNPSTVTLGGVFSLPVTSNSVLSGIGNDGTPTRATTTGTGDVVRATSPTLVTPTAGTSLTVSGANSLALAVGRQGIVNPALVVDTATGGTTITGINIGAQSSGNGVNLSAIGETNVPLIINGAGSGTINFGTISTGQINFYRGTSYQGSSSGAHLVAAPAAAGSGTSTWPTTTGTIVNTGATNTVTNAMLSDMANARIKCRSTSGTGAPEDCTGAQAAAISMAPILYASTAVDFNTTNTDYPISIVLPTGYTKYRIGAITVINTGTTASLTTATCGVWTGAGETGTNLVATATALSAITTNAALTSSSIIASLTQLVSNYYVTSATNTIYFRMKTAQGAAASGTVVVQVIPFP